MVLFARVGLGMSREILTYRECVKKIAKGEDIKANDTYLPK